MTDDNTATTEESHGRRVSRRGFVAGAGAVLLGGTGTVAATVQSAQKLRYNVRVTNVSDGQTLQTTAEGDAAQQPVPLSPVVYAVHEADEPIFTAGEPARDNGLEGVAEDGSPASLVASLGEREAVHDAGVQAVPAGSDEPGPLLPNHSYDFETERLETDDLSLSMVTMFVPSNDLFYALGGATGIPLSSDEQSTQGDVTDHVDLWDAGTEINEEPGVGENQVQRQRGAGVGLVERGTVAPVETINGYDYPDTSDVLRVLVQPR
ncbi:spondin domain-containing protein [Halomicrobium sp. IBSBa]|uniref:spondin domain-containing protein n=1 Tax=Halomicrobium sp. IBSBa TaxID=2778916 RepID=UPI001ABFB8EC|nr:spondin domain-containing protein [Halomicrobium sp. IBSBa]MBO4246629.1 spondin domain-containing protein [Halomicrobium sp. IBSBa]